MELFRLRVLVCPAAMAGLVISVLPDSKRGLTSTARLLRPFRTRRSWQPDNPGL
ncbi:hypothetical protein EK72_003666 [Salmonella enterica subsp. enterica]|nr:hypothetical protein [Salmonella enterica subsp. enterica]